MAADGELLARKSERPSSVPSNQEDPRQVPAGGCDGKGNAAAAIYVLLSFQIQRNLANLISDISIES